MHWKVKQMLQNITNFYIIYELFVSFFSGCTGEEIFASAETVRNKEIVKEKCSTFVVFHSEIQQYRESC